MDTPLPVDTYIAILRALQQRSHGASLVEIAADMALPMPLYRLRDGVNALIAEHRVVRSGANKGARYFLAPQGLYGIDGAKAVAPGGATSWGRDAPVASVRTQRDEGVASPVLGNPTSIPTSRPSVPPSIPAPAPTERPFLSAAALARAGIVPPAPAPPPPPPAPRRVVTPRERAKFKEYLDQLVPALVGHPSSRRDMLQTAQFASEQLSSADQKLFLEVIEAELDNLDPGSAAVSYSIPAAAFTKFQKVWRKG